MKIRNRMIDPLKFQGEVVSLSRRDLSILLPALIAARTFAQSGSNQGGSNDVLPSKCYPFEELPVKTNPESHMESRQVFRGETHGGFEIACHITKLAPGHMPHPPHKHLNEEVLFIHEGTVEMTISGKSCRIGPGSVAYIHSNEMHGMRNIGDTPAEYFVLELDGQKEIAK